jgi:hypothetical protein
MGTAIIFWGSLKLMETGLLPINFAIPQAPLPPASGASSVSPHFGFSDFDFEIYTFFGPIFAFLMLDA